MNNAWPVYNITGCTFNGPKWDATNMNVIEDVAAGLLETAEGLNTLAEVIKHKGMYAPLLQVGPGNTVK